MTRSGRRSLIYTLGLAMAVAGFAGYGSQPLTAQQTPDLFKSTVARDIGPTRQGNRYVDFAVVESSPRVFYAAC